MVGFFDLSVLGGLAASTVADMPGQSGEKRRLGGGEPVAWVRYEDGGVLAHQVARLRLEDFHRSEPWRQVRSRHGDKHFSGQSAAHQLYLRTHG
jgi:hypothetical protein